MKLRWSAALALLLVFSMVLTASADLYDRDEVDALMEETWQQVIEAARQDPVRQEEITSVEVDVPCYDGSSLIYEKMEVCGITDGEHTMMYTVSVIGQPDENGQYPLYICLHGGGYDDDGTINNDQWFQMTSYYRDSVENGIYVAVRGITDEWDLHFDEASYPLYDRLIEDMIVFCDADPDRVYLLGFSAGGDGVYAVAPRMADRFAAVNMSSGHPNGVTLRNLSCLPICIQAGIRDTMFSPKRSVAAAAFDKVLDGYRETYGFGYTHKVYIHVPEGHNYNDHDPDTSSRQLVLSDPQAFVDQMKKKSVSKLFPDSVSYNIDSKTNKQYKKIVQELGLKTKKSDTNAIRFVNKYTRDAHPEALVWDLSVRAAKRETTSFYWLQADSAVDSGIICAAFDRETNTFYIELEQAPNGDFSILLNPLMVDFSRPVYVSYGDTTVEADVRLDADALAASMADTLDPDLSYAAKLSFGSLGFTD